MRCAGRRGSGRPVTTRGTSAADRHGDLFFADIEASTLLLQTLGPVRSCADRIRELVRAISSSGSEVDWAATASSSPRARP